jgi:hypothetical protein
VPLGFCSCEKWVGQQRKGDVSLPTFAPGAWRSGAGGGPLAIRLRVTTTGAPSASGCRGRAEARHLRNLDHHHWPWPKCPQVLGAARSPHWVAGRSQESKRRFSLRNRTRKDWEREGKACRRKAVEASGHFAGCRSTSSTSSRSIAKSTQRAKRRQKRQGCAGETGRTLASCLKTTCLRKHALARAPR